MALRMSDPCSSSRSEQRFLSRSLQTSSFWLGAGRVDFGAHNLKVVGSNPTPATTSILWKWLCLNPPRGGLDLEYLDETSRRKGSLRERAEMDQQIDKKLEHFTNYASKETLGQVHAGGFLHHSIRTSPDGISTAPSQLSNAERQQRITETWREHLAKFPSTAKRPVIAHRLVFSMSKEQHDALTDAGINPDQLLHSR